MKHVTFTTLLMLLLGFGSHSQENQIRYNVIFEPGQVKLTKLHKKDLEEFITSLNNGDQVSIYPLTGEKSQIESTAVEFGNQSFRKEIRKLWFDKQSKVQAQSIIDYLLELDFDLEGMPTNFPSGYRGVSRAINMKYKILHERSTAQPQITDDEPKKYISVKDHFPEKPSQFFTIQPNRDTVIMGKEGTVLYINAGALLSDEEVQVELKEYYQIEDYLKGDLSTRSNGRFIETGGSIYLNASEKDNPNKKVNINPKKGVGVDFTIGENDPNMQVFVKDPNSRETNWVLPQSSQRKTNYRMTRTITDQNGRVLEKVEFDSEEAWLTFLK